MRAWLPPLLYALLILAGSSIPSQALPEAEVLAFDKVLHVVEYSVLGALLYRGLTLTTGWRALCRGAVAAGAALLFGCLDETYQQLTPGRFPSAYDALADGLGAAIGVALAWAWSRRKAHGDDPQLSG